MIDEFSSGCPSDFDQDAFRELKEYSPHKNTRELAPENIPNHNMQPFEKRASRVFRLLIQ